MVKPETAEDLRVGVFVCECGLNIAASVDCDEVRKFAETLPDVVVAVKNKYTCADPGQQEIKREQTQQSRGRFLLSQDARTDVQSLC